MVQVDQTSQGVKKSQKLITEIDRQTEFPQFFKTHFEFEDIILGNRIILRFGLFKTDLNTIDSNLPNSKLFANSELIGANENVLSVGFIEMLRKHKFIEGNMYLLHPLKKEESGHIFYRIKYKTNDLDIKIYDNNKEIEECYYDPFETDKTVIKEKIKNVIIYKEERQFKLEKIGKVLDDINCKLKALALDKNNLNNEKKLLEYESNSLNKNLNRIQSVDEIHIEIDLLGQSKQGIEIIEKKYGKLFLIFQPF